MHRQAYRRVARTRQRATPGNGGFTFAEHPDRAAPDARVIWRADFDPGTLNVVAVPARRTRSADRFDPKRVRAWLAIARDRDGNEHAVLSDGFHRIRIDVEAGSIAEGRPVLLHYKLMGMASAETKTLTLRRFLELCRTGRFSASLFPEDRKVDRWLTVLRVHDALRAGATQRQIAAVLFGEERVQLDWRGESDSLRSRVRRLVRDARMMAKGGYLGLLSGNRGKPAGDDREQLDLDFGEGR